MSDTTAYLDTGTSLQPERQFDGKASHYPHFCDSAGREQPSASRIMKTCLNGPSLVLAMAQTTVTGWIRKHSCGTQHKTARTIRELSDNYPPPDKTIE